MPVVIFLFVVLLVAVFLGIRHMSKKRAEKEILAQGLTDHERAIVAEQVPFVHRLPTELHAKLEGKINLFLNQVDFYGCDGLEVTEEMELSIATQAALLVVNSDAWYTHLTSVLIYPGAFKSKRQEYDGYVVTERETVRLGESWTRGPVILSWQHTERGAQDDKDGYNVAFHEFAHQIDDLSGHTDGAPVLNDTQSFTKWAQVITQAYDRHVKRVQQGEKTVLDAYGAEAHAEFFAVAVEVFFEKPRALKQDEPEVYQQLADLFRLDPATWGQS